MMWVPPCSPFSRDFPHSSLPHGFSRQPWTIRHNLLFSLSPHQEASPGCRHSLDEANSQLSAETERRAQIAAELQEGKLKFKDLEAGNAALKLRLSIFDEKSGRVNSLKSMNEALQAKLTAQIEKLRAKIARTKKAAMPKPAASNLPNLDLPMLVNDPSKLALGFSALFTELNQVKEGLMSARKSTRS